MTENKYDSLTAKANAAFLKAAETVIERARRAGTTIVISEDGQIKELTPDEAEQRLAKHIAAQKSAQPNSPN